MISFPKIKAASYAITKRLHGYHLLKNPAGTPQTEVNMIKESHYEITKHWDDIFQTKRIKKVFSDDGTSTEKKFLMSKHYINVDTLKMTKPRKKDIYYEVKEDGVISVYKDKEDVGYKESMKRKVPKLSYGRTFSLNNDSEYSKMYAKKMDAQHLNRGYYQKHYPLSAKILSFGMHESMLYPTDNRPNFFKVLYHNLTNKG